MSGPGTTKNVTDEYGKQMKLITFSIAEKNVTEAPQASQQMEKEKAPINRQLEVVKPGKVIASGSATISKTEETKQLDQMPEAAKPAEADSK